MNIVRKFLLFIILLLVFFSKNEKQVSPASGLKGLLGRTDTSFVRVSVSGLRYSDFQLKETELEAYALKVVKHPRPFKLYQLFKIDDRKLIVKTCYIGDSLVRTILLSDSVMLFEKEKSYSDILPVRVYAVDIDGNSSKELVVSVESRGSRCLVRAILYKWHEGRYLALDTLKCPVWDSNSKIIYSREDGGWAYQYIEKKQIRGLDIALLGTFSWEEDFSDTNKVKVSYFHDGARQVGAVNRKTFYHLQEKFGYSSSKRIFLY